MILTDSKIIDKLTNGSNVIIDAKCDYCDSEIKISYKLYNRSLKIGNKFSCSHKCASVKRNEMLYEKHGVNNLSYLDTVIENRKKTNLERYGVDNYSKTNEYKEKSKETCLERYGVDNYSKTNEYKEKTNKTNLEKYGVEWSLQSDIVKEKCSITNLNRYGFKQPSKSIDIKNKIINTNKERYGANSATSTDKYKKITKETFLERYGVDNYTKTNEYKIKTKETCLERYGVEHHMMSNDVKESRKKTNLEKYGVETLSHSEDFRIKNYKIANHPDYLRYKENSISIFNCIKGHDFEINIDNFTRRIEQDIPLCTICNPIGDQRSIKEKELLEFIKSVYSQEIITGYRDGLEIDIYLPDLKMGFEFNGLYWHSNKYKDKNYHINKTNYFKDKGIRIIHIWEDDWVFNRSIIESQINNILNNNNNKIFARNCIIKEVSVKECKDFLNKNHIQGTVSSTIKIGLYYNNELVSLMTFNNSEGRKKMVDGYNLNRFCTKLNTNVIGGASKLLKYFIKTYKLSRIVSYADKDWSTGDLYYKLGFNNVGGNGPDYKYIVENKRVHKSRYKKSKLGIKGSSLTESQEMLKRGINKIYDCGKIKFEKLI